jgi:hypothetical protein
MQTDNSASISPQTTDNPLSKSALPPWVPKHPSPEFVRASKILKPLPTEITKNYKLLDRLAMSKDYFKTSFELFGTLNDRQIEQLLADKKIQIPVQSLTDKQRKLLNQYFDAWQNAMAGEPEIDDLLVLLYKKGATENLSNVEVGFDCDGRTFNLVFWKKLPDGKILIQSSTIAMM